MEGVRRPLAASWKVCHYQRHRHRHRRRRFPACSTSCPGLGLGGEVGHLPHVISLEQAGKLILKHECIVTGHDHLVPQ